MNASSYLVATIAAIVAVALTGSQVLTRQALGALEARVDALSAAESELEPPPGPPPRVTELEAAVDELRGRLSLVESARRSSPAQVRAALTATDELSPTAEEAAQARASDAAEGRELEQLLAELASSNWDYSRSEDMERFLKLARQSDLIDERIAELKARVAADPGDVAARMQLADFYTGKLMTVTGPEQGLWGSKAEEQWKQVVALDDGHWRAHSSLGTNYSYYPSVMGKSGDAIHHLERARDIQRYGAPESKHVDTYLFLSRLHQRAGQSEEARAVLEEGLGRHPGDETLAQALEELGG